MTKELPDGSKELKVIGKGSKVFERNYLSEIEDARYSIYEGVNRLSNWIARKNQVFDDILDAADQRVKDAATLPTHSRLREVFFSDSQVRCKKSIA